MDSEKYYEMIVSTHEKIIALQSDFVNNKPETVGEYFKKHIQKT